MKTKQIEEMFQKVCQIPSDINEHLETLCQYSLKCDQITEFGVRQGVSTLALIFGLKKRSRLISYDVIRYPQVDILLDLAEGQFEFHLGDTRKIEIEATDLLFIDTKHTEEQLTEELRLHTNKVRRYLIFHDTVTFGERGEGGGLGLLVSIRNFLRQRPEWKVVLDKKNNNGLMVLERKE